MANILLGNRVTCQTLELTPFSETRGPKKIVVDILMILGEVYCCQEYSTVGLKPPTRLCFIFPNTEPNYNVINKISEISWECITNEIIAPNAIIRYFRGMQLHLTDIRFFMPRRATEERVRDETIELHPKNLC